jgi:hypothetical protein
VTASEWTLTVIVISCTAFIAWAAPRAYRDLRDVWRSRRPLPSWQQLALESPPVSSPAHDAIQLSDDEEYAFAELMLGYFQREDAP